MRNPSRRSPGYAAAALALALAVLGLGSCAKKITEIDASLQPPVYPEGRSANANLLVYMDTPIHVVEWEDLGLPGASPEDTIVSERDVYDAGPGTLIGTIIDSTDASAFDVFRQLSSGGYGPLQDVSLHPVKSWLQSHTELYRFFDANPTGSRSYIGRGVVNGLVTAQAPLTNVAKLVSSSVAGDLEYLGNVATSPPPADSTRDSMILMKWQAVPGAVGYWINVTSLTAAALQREALYKSALPRPVFPERFPEYFVGYVPAPNTSYKLGNRALPGVRQLLFDTLLTNNQYVVRITAVDANGQVLSYTRDGAKAAVAVQRTSTTYILFPLGCVLVKPVPPDLPPAPASQVARAGPFANMRPGDVAIVRRDQLPAAWRR